MPRILHAPTDVGGNAYGLSRAERELGLESDVVVLTASRFGYRADTDLDSGRPHPVWTRFGRRVSFLRRALSRYDVFHFNFGQTILSVREYGLVVDELALLKRAGKTVLATYQGCDVRAYADCYCRNVECARRHQYRAPAAERMVRYADRVLYLNPDLRKWLPGARFAPYASVDPRALEPAPLPGGAELLVVHAPTDRNIKGTRHVVEAVDALRAEGLPLRLELLEGLNHEEVRQRLRDADLVVDQLLIGWYGAFAVEAMALGRPVLCFIEESEPGDNPFGDELPIVRTSPATLADDLRSLAQDAERRRALGQAGRAFAEHHHDPLRIARGVLEGVVPLPERAQAERPAAVT